MTVKGFHKSFKVLFGKSNVVSFSSSMLYKIVASAMQSIFAVKQILCIVQLFVIPVAFTGII